MGTGEFNAGGVTLRWTSIPSRGEWKYSQSRHATETGISSGLMGHLARTQTLPYPLVNEKNNLQEFATTKQRFPLISFPTVRVSTCATRKLG